MAKTRRLTITLEDEDTTLCLQRNHDEDCAWPTLLQDFVTFLSGAGYIGVEEKVEIVSNKFNTDGWYGKVRTPGEE